MLVQPKVKTQAKVHEIFASRQGEGPYVGLPQIFLRFSRCNMTCLYCDTDNNIGKDRSFKSVVREAEKLFWQTGPLHSLSLTGGEPLLYPQFIRAISKWARQLGMMVFLETNATLPKAFNEVASSIDVVSIDIKLPSVGKTPSFWKEHVAFLKSTRGKIRYIKIVLSKETKKSEFDQAINLIENEDVTIPLILQPVTPLNGISAIDEAMLLELKEKALNQLWDVRIQPQWHKFWGIK